MSWNYRVIENPDGYYTIHEVYYNQDNQIVLYSAEAIAPGGETLEELRSDLMYMAAALSKTALLEKDIEFGIPDWEEEE